VEKELLADAKHRMNKAVEAVRTEFNTVRSGRASVGLLDRIHVDYYGTSTPLKQMANIAAPEPRLLRDADVLGLAVLPGADVGGHDLGGIADQEHVAEAQGPAEVVLGQHVVAHVLGVGHGGRRAARHAGA